MLGCWVNPAEMCLLWNDFELGRSRRRRLCYRCRCRRPGERARNRISQAGMKRVKKRRRKRVEGGLLLLLLRLLLFLLLGKKQRKRKGRNRITGRKRVRCQSREQSGAEPQQPESCSHFLSSDGVGPRDSRIYCRKDRKRVVVDGVVDCQGGWEEY